MGRRWRSDPLRASPNVEIEGPCEFGEALVIRLDVYSNEDMPPPLPA